MTGVHHSFGTRGDFETLCGIRPRSWALPLMITFTPSLQEIAVGPFYVARELVRLPF